MVVIGFDFGMKYIGVAAGQALTNTASALPCLQAKDGIPDWQQIDKLIAEWKPEYLLVGIPYNMDGSEQYITSCARKFANRIQEKTKMPVDLVDERLSTWEAKQILPQGRKKKQDYLNKLNSLAAKILVEQWLNSRGKNENN